MGCLVSRGGITATVGLSSRAVFQRIQRANVVRAWDLGTPWQGCFRESRIVCLVIPLSLATGSIEPKIGDRAE